MYREDTVVVLLPDVKRTRKAGQTQPGLEGSNRSVTAGTHVGGV